MSSSAAEKKVKKLARLPSNTVCANCGTTKKFGFSTVCIKYFTFVCNNCKSSHQAISHRCKSLTMSSWTDEEAAELKRKGNDYARRTWLKNAPPVGQGGRPREGDPVDVFKRFVVDVYERKRYYGEDEGGAASAVATSAPPVVAAAPAPRVAPRAPMVTTAPVRKAVPAPAPPAAPVADLLDFTSMSISQSGATNNAKPSNTFEANFDAFAPAASASSSGPVTSVKTAPAPIQNDPFQPSTTQTTVLPNGSSNGFKANFDAFAPAASVTSPAPSTAAKPATTPIVNDPFQPNTTQATEASTGSSFSFINNSITTPPAPAPAPTPPAMKKPVMNNHSMSQKSSLISSMSMPAPNNMQQGRNNMGTGMGWNNNNNNLNSFGGLGNMNTLQQQQMMQQQQMNMMNGMCMNNNSMGFGMMGNNNNPMMMMGGNNNPMMNSMMMMGNNNNSMMMGQQRNMTNGFGGMAPNGGGANGKSKGAMQSLQMNSASMNAWSTGFNK